MPYDRNFTAELEEVIIKNLLCGIDRIFTSSQKQWGASEGLLRRVARLNLCSTKMVGRLGMVVPICNPTTGETEAGGSQD
jgi:hypothetical protein